ncbi:hypothetical protein [Microcoleus sp. B3-A4]|uniref:hypothetical protein n=1 Tax=Microcoleus sp. B3-A4 TaxID=2818653 RepID=UPI002FD412F8
MAKKVDRLPVIDIKCTGWQKSPPEGGLSEIIKKVFILLTFTQKNDISVYCETPTFP